MEQEKNRQEKMAGLILELRKARGLTQKDLADRLGVTDKAVSKWERSVSSPDISLLIPLAEALGVSVGELLKGEREEGAVEAGTETVVHEALAYSGKSASLRVKRMRAVFFAGLSFVFLLGAVVCFICDFAVSGALSWSWLVLVSLSAAWGVLAPLFWAETNRIRKSLLVFSALTAPYLIVLSILLEVPLLRTMGICIAAAGLLGLWGIYLVAAYKWNHRKYFALSMICLILAAEEYGINGIVTAFFHRMGRSGALWFTQFMWMLLLLFMAVCFGLRSRFSH